MNQMLLRILVVMKHKEILSRLEGGDLTVLDELSPVQRAVIHRVAKGINDMDPRPAAEVLRAGRDSIVVSIDEFVESDEFMGVDFAKEIYPIWRDELRYVLDLSNEINLWFIRGSVGGGKSFISILSLLYKMYETSTYTNPTAEYGLASDSNIVCGLFNATKYLADDVNYGDLSKFLFRCRYFASVRDQIRTEERKRRGHGNILDLPKGLRVALGSDQFQVLGKNVLWGILDEANWRDRALTAAEHDKIYGAFQAVIRRIKTRFAEDTSYIPGMLFIAVSSEREMSYTMDRLCEEYGDLPHTHITQFSIWEARPAAGDENVFYIGVPPHMGMPPRIFDDEDEARAYASEGGNVIAVPRRFRTDFDADLIGALNDLAGVRIETGSSKFFYLPERIEDCVDVSRVNPVRSETITHGMNSVEPLSDYFDLDAVCTLYDATTGQYRPKHFPNSNRVLHTDLAINHDAAGIVCSCLGNPVIQTAKGEVQRIQLPEYTIWTDFFMRIVAPPGGKIHFSAIRQFIVWLTKTAGFPIGLLSWDGFESEDSTQIMEKRGYKVTKFSVDRTVGPYSTLRDVMQYVRMSMPKYEYIKVELKHLEMVKRKGTKTKKIDHPKNMLLGSKMVPGSKDVADGAAATTSQLITRFAAIHVVSTPDKIMPPIEKLGPAQSIGEWLKQDERPTMRDLVLSQKGVDNNESK